MPYPCNNPPEGPEVSGVVPRTWGRKGCCGKTKDADMAEVPGRKRFGDETEYGSASSLPEISKGIRIV